MQIHDINLKKPRRATRIARGGKRGTTGGRGTKGQKSRAGSRMRPAYRDLIMRIPKRRGFRNKPISDKPYAVNLADLNRPKVKGDGKAPVAINRESLRTMGLLPARFRGQVKLLGTGDISFPIIVSGIKTSDSVKAKIEKAGGKVNA